MATHKLTDEQMQAVESNGTVLVSAAAGSGKTSVLTEKVVNLLSRENDPCDADRLLVVTFTNAAAAEMRSRIEERLNEECAKNPANKRLLKQKLLLSRSSICTIDSFCMDLVRENFYDLKLDPEFNIINAGMFIGLRETALEEILRKSFLEDEESFKAVLDSMEDKFGDSKLKAAILGLYGFTRSLQDPAGWLRKVIENYETPQSLSETLWFGYIRDYIERVVRDVVRKINVALKHIDTTFVGIDKPKIVQNFYDAYSKNIGVLETVLQFNRDGEWDKVRFKVDAIEIIRLNGKDALLEYGPAGESILAEVTHINDELKDIIKKDISNFYYADETTVFEHIKRDSMVVRFLAQSTIELEEKLIEKCREKSAFTFDMIEHLALQLLKSEAGKEIANRYDWVLVDEYQDVNELQGTIFRFLSDMDERLFAVGDVKQSIYGFRQADPRLFLERKDKYTPYDGKNYPAKVILDANFRSRSGVCDFVNATFEKIMSREICGMDYLEEDSLKACAKYSSREEADTQIHIVDSEYMETADAVAEYINKTINDGVMVGREGEEHPVSYKDFAILMRAPSTHTPKYIEALSLAGIPVTAEMQGFWENDEIATVCSALRVINNPCDDVALLSAVMSCPNGLNADDVANLRLASDNKNTPLYIPLCDEAESGNEKAMAICKKLQELRRLASASGVSTVVNAVYDWLDILNTVKFSPDRENKTANLLRLLSIAADYEKGDNADLQSFCDFIRWNVSFSDEKSAMSPTGADAVRIMSIHKSKGLQFPICIIAECDAPFNFSDSNGCAVMHEQYGLAVNYLDLKECTKHSSLAKRVVASAIKDKNIAEEIRLLYVAMTRAEDKLVFFSKEKNPEEKLKKTADALVFERDKVISAETVRRNAEYANWVYMSLLLHPNAPQELRRLLPKDFEGEAERSCVEFLIHRESKPETVLKPVPECSVDGQLIDEIKSRVEYEYPFSDLLDIAAKASVTMLSKERGERVEFTDTPSFLSGTMLTPAQRGTALHKFMQFCDFKKCEKSISEEADRLAEMEFIGEIERDALDIEALERFFSGDMYRRIKNSPMVMREQRFLSKLPVSRIKPELCNKFPEETVVIQGAADCVFVEDGGLVVLDFKSDRVKSAEELVERYAVQLDIYANVFSDMFQIPIKQKVIYSFKLGKEISV